MTSATEVPNGWEAVVLGEVLSPVSDRVDPRSCPASRFVGLEQVEPHTNRVIETLEARTVTSSSVRFREGDVLYGRMRPYLNKVFRADFSGLASGEFIVLRETKSLDSRFLVLRMSSSDFVDFACAQYSGDRPRVKLDQLKTFPLLLPPRTEQTRIVDKLEELLSDLDAAVAELKAAQRKLTKYRQSLLKAAVEGALTADWRAARDSGRSQTSSFPRRRESSDLEASEALDSRLRGNDGETGAELLQRILAERRARWEQKQLAKFAEQGKQPPSSWQEKYQEPVPPCRTDLPDLPDGWVWVSAEQVCDFITKGTTPPKGVDSASERTVPFLRVTNLTSDGSLDLADRVFVSVETHRNFLARSIAYPGDVLMNIVGPPLGQVSIVTNDFSEWNVNQAIAIFRPLMGLSPRYISFVLLASPMQKWLKKRAKTTAGQTNLTLELCRGLPLPLPPMEEQLRITELLGALLEEGGRQSLTIQRAIQQAAAQRKNILKAAFSGRLVPQNPNDEPASLLLDCIRAERTEVDGVASKRRGRKVKVEP